MASEWKSCTYRVGGGDVIVDALDLPDLAVVRIDGEKFAGVPVPDHRVRNLVERLEENLRPVYRDRLAEKLWHCRRNFE